MDYSIDLKYFKDFVDNAGEYSYNMLTNVSGKFQRKYSDVVVSGQQLKN